jgi:CelD/BcsL family acetyltransferase involved in cellulose biosynthesis
MEVRRISTSEQLQALAPHWNRLARGVPFRSWQWLGTWWQHYGGPNAGQNSELELFTLCVYDQGELIAIAPWYVQMVALHGRVVQFLGSGEVCSDYASVLCKTGWEDKAAKALAQWLVDDKVAAPDSSIHDWDQFAFTGIDAGDVMMQCLVNELSARGALTYCRPGDSCWRIMLPETWEEYLAMLSRSHRKELMACRRALFDTGRAVLYTAGSEDEVEQGWRVLIELHEQRRQSLGEVGCFSRSRFAAFHRQAINNLFRNNQLRLHWLELDGRPVAAEYHLVSEGVIYAYQSGIDVETLRHGPGRLAMMAILREALGEGYRWFDLLRGDEPYKAHWRAQPRPTVQIGVLPGRGADRLRYGMWVAGDSMKGWIKQRLNVTGATTAAPVTAEHRNLESRNGETRNGDNRMLETRSAEKQAQPSRLENQ